jgi:Thioredoxin reductase
MIVDVAIIGSGPAGIQAAIHSARKKAKTVIIGKKANSALAGAHVENYFGIEGTAQGMDLLRIGLEQARSFGCEVIEQNVLTAHEKNGLFIISTESGKEITAKSVILATGIQRMKLNVPGEKEFLGKGVSYCASCDCNFFKGVPVAIVGNESEAAISAALMTQYASKVYWITDRTDADPILVDKAKDSGAEIVASFPSEIRGAADVTSVVLKNGQEVAVNGVFIELGGRSSADLAMDLGVMPEIDDTVLVNPTCETTVKGIYACGDLTGKPWQIAKAVGQGAIAGENAANYSKVVK